MSLRNLCSKRKLKSTVKDPCFLSKHTNKDEDEMRAWKDVATGFVTSYFIPVNAFDIQQEFLKMVIDRMNAYLTQYDAEVRLIYKGGNMMHNSVRQFLLGMPLHASLLASDAFSGAFRPSDCDFEVRVPWADIPDHLHRRVLREVTDIVTAGAVEIRGKILEDPSRWFYYSRLSRRERAKLLGALQFPEIDLSTGERLAARKVRVMTNRCKRHDLRMRFVDQDTMIETCERLDEGPHNLFVSCNEALKFTKSSGATAFNLVRVKVNFAVHSQHRTHKVGGELLDFSIPTFEDDVACRHSFKTTSKSIVKVNWYASQFYTFSINYMFKDLERILFNDVVFPWQDRKYGKRLQRIVAMLMFSTLRGQSSECSWPEAIRVMQSANRSMRTLRGFTETLSDILDATPSHFSLDVTRIKIDEARIVQTIESTLSVTDSEQIVAWYERNESNLVGLITQLRRTASQRDEGQQPSLSGEKVAAEAARVVGNAMKRDPRLSKRTQNGILEFVESVCIDLGGRTDTNRFMDDLSELMVRVKEDATNETISNTKHFLHILEASLDEAASIVQALNCGEPPITAEWTGRSPVL